MAAGSPLRLTVLALLALLMPGVCAESRDRVAPYAVFKDTLSSDASSQERPDSLFWLSARLRPRKVHRAPSEQLVTVGALAPTGKVAKYISMDIRLEERSHVIPQSFLGISHEWNHLEEIATGDDYLRLIRDLSMFGAGPLIFRIGGSSTDKQVTVPSPEVWRALAQLHNRTGARFMIGLNFEANNMNLTIAQKLAAEKYLPLGSIRSFELGNEPNYYANRSGMPAYKYMSCCYVNDWNMFAFKLSCPDGNWRSCKQGMFSGPAWGHVMLEESKLDWFLRACHQWVDMVTLHWYKDTTETFNSPESALDETPTRRAMNYLAKVVAVANNYNKKTRVAEMNTISNAGRRGISNALSGALWTIDNAFEAAAAGTVGINLHWGDGHGMYAGVIRGSYNGTSKPSVILPPYYAYLMFQMAVGRGSQLLRPQIRYGKDDDPRVKVWPVVDTDDATLRVVLINKNHAADAMITLKVNRAWYHTAYIIRLQEPHGRLDASENVALGNLVLHTGYVPEGTPTREVLHRQRIGVGRVAYSVYLPPASAALVVIHKRSVGIPTLE